MLKKRVWGVMIDSNLALNLTRPATIKPFSNKISYFLLKLLEYRVQALEYADKEGERFCSVGVAVFQIVHDMVARALVF